MMASCDPFELSTGCDKKCVREDHLRTKCYTFICDDPTCASSLRCSDGNTCTVHIPVHCSSDFSFDNRRIMSFIEDICSKDKEEIDAFSFSGECDDLSLRIWVQNKTHLCQPENRIPMTMDCDCKTCMRTLKVCSGPGQRYCGCEIINQSSKITSSTQAVTAFDQDMTDTASTSTERPRTSLIQSSERPSMKTITMDTRETTPTKIDTSTTDALRQPQISETNQSLLTPTIGGAVGGSIAILILALFVIVLIRVRLLKKSSRRRKQHTSVSFSNRDYGDNNVIPSVNLSAVNASDYANTISPECRDSSENNGLNAYVNSTNIRTTDANHTGQRAGEHNKDNYFVLEKADKNVGESEGDTGIQKRKFNINKNGMETNDEDNAADDIYNALNENSEKQDGDDTYHHVKSMGGFKNKDGDLQDYDHLQNQFERQDNDPDDVYDHCKNAGPDDEYGYDHSGTTASVNAPDNDYDLCRVVQQHQGENISSEGDYGNL